MNTTGSDTLPGDAAVNTRFARTPWFNALWFQSVWFCAVLGRETLLPLTLGLLVLHLFLVRDTRRELLQMGAIALVGFTVDACLGASGLFRFPGGALPPIWLCCLWLAFGAALPRSLKYLSGRPWLTALAGMVILPLNYWAGQKLGAVHFDYSLPLTLGVMAVSWAILLPVLYRITAIIQGAVNRSPAP